MTNHSHNTINLDYATRGTIIADICAIMIHGGRTFEALRWRQTTGGLSFVELLAAADHAGFDSRW